MPGCAQVPALTSSPPVVATDAGSLRGARVEGVYAFRGIPYAAPPVGALRWRPPQAHASWSGVRPAIDYAATCAQPLSTLMPVAPDTLAEDCLTLNVWTPDTRPGPGLPVMVWIHGGGFTQGSGNSPLWNGSVMPKRGVVLVTINYRLAMFGFLAHPGLTRPGDPVGNYGLLDAVAALRWVQRNIAAFGGDPDRVTIFGESAGADAVNYLMVLPAARGLFHAAISQSSSVGMAPAPRLRERAGFNPSAQEMATRFIGRVGLPDATDLAVALREVPAERLLAVMSDRERFSPVVDGVTLPDQVGLLFAAGAQQKVPYITGGNSWEASLGRAIGGGFSPAIATRLVPEVDKARLYPGLAGDTLDDAVFGDLVILSQTRYLAGQMRQAGAPTYVYFLSYVASARRDHQPGAAHADDIPFVMGTLDRDPRLTTVSRQDRAVSALMTDYWVQFAKTGNPNQPGLPSWPVWERDTAFTPVLEIGNEAAVREGLLADRLAYHVHRGQARLDQLR